MPAKPGKDEQVFIRLFVSAYEDSAWAGSRIDPLDERIDGAPEALITRSDGQTMAIEHTLIEPFVGDKRDFAMSDSAFREIEQDESLAVADTGITVYVPVGILDGQNAKNRRIFIDAIHSWIAQNRLHLHEGKQSYHCDVRAMSGVTLTIERRQFGSQPPTPGVLSVRRQQVSNDLDKVIERALRKKLPKLVKTEAHRHVLFLERDQFTFFPDLIFAEIERQRPKFALLSSVDEIWHVETIGYKQGILYFELPMGGRLRATMIFVNGELVAHSRDGMSLLA